MAEGQGYQTRSIASLLSVPIVAFLIVFILFGPIVLTSLMSTFSFVPINVWIVLAVVYFIYKSLK